MFWVGCFGGLSYSNSFYYIVKGTYLPKELKELAVNICGVCIEIGILIAGIFGVFISNFVILNRK